MWNDRIRNIFGGEPSREKREGSSSGRKRGFLSFGGQGVAAEIVRRSSGAEQFFKALRPDETLSILDLAGASQANVSYILGLGHRLSSEDIMGAIDQCFGDGDFLENQGMASRGQRFLDQVLQFPPEHFDAALVWDTLQFLVPPLLDQVVERLLHIMRPGGIMLAFFSSSERASTMPLYQYRIQDEKSLVLVPKSTERPIRYYNNRGIERLFHDAQSLKFFLSRDHLREVLIRR